MACKCFDEVADRMRDRIKERVGDSIAKVVETGFAHTVLLFDRGDYCNVMLPFTFRYYKKKKNGELEQRQTNADCSVAINFCPFCGTKFEGKAATSQQ
jgi:hypothetical protein